MTDDGRGGVASHDPRWRSATGAALLCLAVGLLAGAPVVLAAGIVPLVYLAVGSLTGVPDSLDDSVSVERTVDRSPVPGYPAEVTVTVENTSDAPLADLRIVDGVPPALRVVDGSPRATMALTPGAADSFSYSLLTVRGDHEFGETRVQTRNATASAHTTASVTASGDAALSARVSLDDVPLPPQTMHYTGSLPTRTGGNGVEFFSTREYRRGDPLTRIHWRQLAKTGELTTVNFRENRAAKVVFVVDARSTTRVAPEPGYPSALGYAEYATVRLLHAVLDDGQLAGVATYGTATTATPAAAPIEWIAPGRGAELQARVSALFDAVHDAPPSPGGEPTLAEPTAASGDGQPASAGVADGGRSIAAMLRQHLPADAQVFLVSPLLDEQPAALLRTLRAHGHATTVLSPDVTAPADTPGGALRGVDRALAVRATRETGARVLDWNPLVPLPLALARMQDFDGGTR